MVAAVCALWSLPAHDMVPAPPQGLPILLQNGVIHTVSGETLQNGSILLADGKIQAIGLQIEPPEGASVVDLAGRHVYPGLVSPMSHLGLIEIAAVRATRDTDETGGMNPNAQAATAFNPDSEAIPVTRANGVLTTHVFPAGGLLAGQSVVVNLDGWTIEDMSIKSPAGMRINWPGPPREPRFDIHLDFVSDLDRSEEDYAKELEKLRELFADARAFREARSVDPDTPVDLRQEALVRALDGEFPLFVSAQALRQIRDAVNWAKSEGLEIVIVGGRDAWRAADLLKANDVSVIISAVNSLPSRRWESYDVEYANPKRLHEAGVRFAIGIDNFWNERNLPYEAAKAVAHGLPPEEALKAVTVYPAEILGVADRLGTLQPGKDGTLIVTNGDPLDIRTIVELAYVKGRPVDLSSRHTQLYEKYQKKYDQLRGDTE